VQTSNKLSRDTWALDYVISLLLSSRASLRGATAPEVDAWHRTRPADPRRKGVAHQSEPYNKAVAGGFSRAMRELMSMVAP